VGALSDVVIVALIGGAGSLLGSLFGILASNKLTTYRIEQLEKKVDKHNSVIDRTYKLEKDVAMLKQHVDDVHKNDEQQGGQQQ
jgi:ABC-type branched-subunit amino acid transport system permease subunit